ncbi:MAG TPA: phosphotransferase [Nocardioidaceae bacterium]|nr:phosphotransferase [Nocardioidaceae bacterium]
MRRGLTRRWSWRRAGSAIPGALGHDRSLDWRFLLPPGDGRPFGVLRLLAGDPCVAGRVAGLGLARETVTTSDDDRPVDALIALGGRPDAVLRAARTVRPGGVLYCHVDRLDRRTLRWSPRRYREALQALGFDTAVYWRRRQAGKDTLFVPVDFAAPGPWFVEEAMGDRRPARRMVRTVLRLLMRGDGRHLALLAGRYAVVGVARTSSQHPAGSAALTPAVVLTDQDQPRPSIVLARGEGAWSRVVFLVFDPQGEQPSLVVKVPRKPEHNYATEREHRTLATLGDLLQGDDLAATVPRSLGVRYWAGLAVGTETFVPGRPLAFGSRADGHDDTARLHRAVGWLIDLHRATRAGEVDLSSADAALLDERLLDVMGLHGLARSRVQRLLLPETAPPATVPLVWQHCDLTPRNMRWDGFRHSVVDWEAARVGPALCDLLYLLLHWSWPGGVPFGSAPQRVFDEVFAITGNEPAERAQRQVRRYCDALGVAPHLVPVLLAAMLGQQALDRVERISDSGGDPVQDDNVYAALLQSVLARGEPVPAWSTSW